MGDYRNALLHAAPHLIKPSSYCEDLQDAGVREAYDEDDDRSRAILQKGRIGSSGGGEGCRWR
jgi:hypothetical protein